MSYEYASFDAFSTHFPKVISAEISDYATNTVLDWSRYLFTRRVKGIQFAFCTHCKKEHVTDGKLKHKDTSNCKYCGSTCKVKASGLGRGKMFDEAYLLYYMKSEINPDAIIAQGYYLTRDYREDYHRTETEMKVVSMYLFEPGHSKMYRREYWPKYDNSFIECKTVFSEAVRSMAYKRSYHATHSIREAVEGTPFKYCTWEKYDNQDYVRIFDLAARYQCIEFLTKVGLRSVVEAKLGAGQTYGVIHWHGKTPEKVLRMTKQEIKDMRGSGVKVTPEILDCYHRSKRQGLNYTIAEAAVMQNLEQGYYSGEIRKMMPLASAFQIKKYLVKQSGKSDVKANYRYGSELFVAWRDYTKECKELGMDLSKDHILFPNNLYSAHQKTMQKVQVKLDAALNKLIADRLPEMKQFLFEKFDLIIRPVTTSNDLFEEGSTLEHCVGRRYTKDHAQGETTILFLRRSVEPDKPFYTLEVKDGKVLQCQGGVGSRQMTPQVKKFIEAFVSEKLTKKSKKRKTKSIKPQGVAV